MHTRERERGYNPPKIKRAQYRNPILGRCGYFPFPDSGAYGEWSCGRTACHIGPHRFNNYTTPRLLGRLLAWLAPRRLARTFPRSRYRPVDYDNQRTWWVRVWTGGPAKRPAHQGRATDA